MNICLASMIWFGRGWVLSFIWLVSSRVPHLSGCVAVGTMACRKAVLQVDRRGSTPERLLRWLRDLSRVCWLICPGWGLLVLLAPGLRRLKLLRWFPCRTVDLCIQAPKLFFARWYQAHRGSSSPWVRWTMIMIPVPHCHQLARWSILSRLGRRLCLASFLLEMVYPRWITRPAYLTVAVWWLLLSSGHHSRVRLQRQSIWWSMATQLWMPMGHAKCCSSVLGASSSHHGYWIWLPSKQKI